MTDIGDQVTATAKTVTELSNKDRTGAFAVVLIILVFAGFQTWVVTSSNSDLQAAYQVDRQRFQTEVSEHHDEEKAERVKAAETRETIVVLLQTVIEQQQAQAARDQAAEARDQEIIKLLVELRGNALAANRAGSM